MSERPNSRDPLDANRDHGFIPQIFNYCDRWCERCAFTLRCRVYALEAEMAEADDADEDAEEMEESELEEMAATAEADDDDAWPAELEDSDFQEPIHDLKSDGEGETEDATLFQYAEATLRERAAHERGGSFVQSSDAYAWRVRAFIEEHPELADEDIATLVQALGAQDTHPAEIKGQVVRLADALEMILWHPFLITAKLRRAFLSQVDELVGAGEEEPRDSDGSAKVALLAMDRSLSGWAVMAELMPMYAELAADCQARLERLRRHIEEQFPAARAFLRPGFDE